MKTLWFLWFSLTSTAVGVVSTIGSCVGASALFNMTHDDWYFTVPVILAITSFLCGIAIGLFFGVSLYKDVHVLRNVRKHMVLYWIYWIVLGGAFALIGSASLLLPVLALGAMG